MAAPTEPESEFRMPLRPGGWTVDDVLALPEDHTAGQRVELMDGTLLVSPAPNSAHQRLLQKLQFALAPGLPEATELLPGVNVRFGENRLLVPDFVVLTCPAVDTVSYLASDVLMAAEIESPSTRVEDRIVKRALYAEGRVPFYLLVDPSPSPASATLFALGELAYESIAKSENGRLVLTRPFEVTLDLRH